MYRVYQTFTKTAPAFVLPPNHMITNDLRELASFADEWDAATWCDNYNKKHPCKKEKIPQVVIKTKPETVIFSSKPEQKVLLFNGCDDDYQKFLEEGWQIKQIAGSGSKNFCWLLLERVE